ncbi:MAG: hypothetical protein O7E57_09050 [Gammaproteobacteria bacterium]|nr:hypothetical protein [Gammaproteobacteria bacterium]
MQEQAYNSPSDSDHTDGESLADEVERLTAELSKWRERVPKLSAALRERTERVKSLEQRLLDPGKESDPGINARDELIGELEVKIQELNSLHQEAQGQLHSGSLEIDELRSEAQSWKTKWQSLTQSLDSQASVFAEQESNLKEKSLDLASLRSKLDEHAEELDVRANQIQTLSDEVESLSRRNENLFETTELANKQIGTLGDNLNELRGELREKDRTAEAVDLELDELKVSLAAETSRSLGKDEEIQVLQADVEGKRQTAVELEGRIDRLREEAEDLKNTMEGLKNTIAGLENTIEGLENTIVERDAGMESLFSDLGESRERVTQLESSVAAAEEAAAAHDEERREFSSRIAGQEEQIQKMETRSGQVANLEKEKHDLQSSVQALEVEKRQLDREAATAERHILEHVDHVNQLEEELRREQELTLSLEKELAKAQQNAVAQEQEQARVLDENTAQTAENAVKLEEELNHAVADSCQAVADSRKMEQDRDDFAGRVEQLETELSDQKRETAKLEQSLQASNKILDEIKSSGVDVEKTDSQQTDVRNLEQMVRDRTEQLNQLQWRQDMADKNPEDSSTDGKLMLVLNQQLEEARTANKQLREQLRTLEAGRRENGPTENDDLTQIRGVGEKLALQLNDLGIYRFEQIADLDISQLTDASHVLHAHKGRIERDEWIQQAAQLLG